MASRASSTMILAVAGLVGFALWQNRRGAQATPPATNPGFVTSRFSVGDEVRVVFPDGSASAWFRINRVRVVGTEVFYDEINLSTGQQVTVSEAQIRESERNSPGTTIEVRPTGYASVLE